MKKSKVCAIIVVLVMMVSCLAACGNNSKNTGNQSTSSPTTKPTTAATDSTSKDPTTAPTTGGEAAKTTDLEMWTFIELHGQHFQKMVEKWNIDNPTRQINLKVTVLPYEDMHSKLQIALQTGEGAPDICDIELGKFANFLKGEPQLEVLNDVVEPYKDKIVQSRLDIYSKDGNVYGIPSHVGATVAFYNKEILEAAGVDYTKIVTWADFKEAGLKVKEKTGKFMGTADTGALWQLNVLLAQQGVDWVSDDGTVNVNIPEAKRALEMLKDLQDSGVISTVPGGNPDTEEAYAYYNSGEVACAIMPLWQMSRYTNYMTDLKGKIAIAKVPVLEEGMPCSVGGGGTGTVVTKTCADVQLAKDFLAYAKLTVDGNIGLWENLGFDPCNTDVWTMEDVTHNKDNQFVQYFLNNPFDVLNSMKGEIGLIKCTEAYPTINTTFSSITLNSIFESGENIDDALAEAQQQIENDLK